MMNSKRVLSELFEDDSSRNENSIGSFLANELAEGIHEHMRKTEQLSFCESPKEDVNKMSLVHEKNRVQLYDFSTNESNLRNSTRSGKQLATMRQTVKRTCLGMICQYLPRLSCSLSRYRECTESHILKHKSRLTMRQPLVALLTCFRP